MSDKELEKQKMQAQVDEWRAEADKLEAQAKGASADAQLELNERLEALQRKIDEGKTSLDALVEKGKEAWNSLKD